VQKTGHERREAFYVDDWLVDPRTDRVSRDQHEVKLEPRVMDLLLYMASRPGEVVTREELEAAVWAGMIVGYDSLTSAMIKLRKAFDDDSRNPKIIETVSKRGYRLIAPVKAAPAVTEPQDTESAPAVTEPQDTESAPATPDFIAPHPRLPRRLLLSVALLVVAVALLVGLYVLRTGLSPQPTQTQQDIASGRTSLVVLPFTNSNDDKSQEYFSDGITDDLISDLSRFSGLNVIARRTAYIYKNRHPAIQTIARELGVKYIVDGDVRRDGNRLRLNVQLINASNGVNIWARRFDREVSDIFQVQDDIRNNILNALSLKLTQLEHQHKALHYTSSFDAYDLFLQAQAIIVSRSSQADNQQAIDLLQQAIKLDPGFARAHAALAYNLVETYRLAWAQDLEKVRQQALAEGNKAIEIDPQLPQAYWILGNVYLFLYENHAKAIEMAKHAIELAPHDNDSYLTLAVSYAYGDSPEQAKQITREIMQKNAAYSSLVPSVLGLANLVTGNLPEALSAFNKALEINPAYINAIAWKALVLYRMGREADARFVIDELYNVNPDFNVQKWGERLPFKDKNFSKGIVADLLKLGAHT